MREGTERVLGRAVGRGISRNLHKPVPTGTPAAAGWGGGDGEKQRAILGDSGHREDFGLILSVKGILGGF